MLPVQAEAQSGLSLQATVGASVGGGGSYGQRDGAAMDLLLALPVRQTRAGTLVAGITAGIHGRIVSDLECVNDRSGRGCLPGCPVFISAGPLAGVQRASATGASARVLAGPGFFGGDKGTGVGLQGRLDVATRPLFHVVSLVASLRGALPPRVEGKVLTQGSFGLGLRIQ